MQCMDCFAESEQHAARSHAQTVLDVMSELVSPIRDCPTAFSAGHLLCNAMNLLQRLPNSFFCKTFALQCNEFAAATAQQLFLQNICSAMQWVCCRHQVELPEATGVASPLAITALSRKDQRKARQATKKEQKALAPAKTTMLKSDRWGCQDLQLVASAHWLLHLAGTSSN